MDVDVDPTEKSLLFHVQMIIPTTPMPTLNHFRQLKNRKPGTSGEQIGMNTMNRLPTERGPRTAETSLTGKGGSYFPQEDQAWAFVKSLNPDITSLDLEVLADSNSEE